MRDDGDGLKEPLVYKSGVLADLCGGVRAARYYTTQDVGEVQLLWLEDLSDALQPPWSLDQFVDAARYLGRFNAFWPEQSLPTWEWLGRPNSRSLFTSRRFRDNLERLPEMQKHPMLRRVVSPGMIQTLQRLPEDTESLFAQTADGPQGISHGNCHSRNLFPMRDARYGSHLVAIDWVKTCIDSYGEDAGHLLGSAINWNDVDVDEAKQIADAILGSYVSGLHDSGWSGNEDQVRLTYLTRLGCEANRAINIALLSAENEEARNSLLAALKKPIESIYERQAEAIEFYIACRDEALRLSQRLRASRRP